MSHLPDELILKILSFCHPVDLVNCRMVSKQLYRLSMDEHLVKQFPHITIGGTVYLKEYAYRCPELLRTILLRRHNDLDWLVSRQTEIMKEIGVTLHDWCLSFAAYSAAFVAAANMNVLCEWSTHGAAWSSAWHHVTHPAWCYYMTKFDGVWNNTSKKIGELLRFDQVFITSVLDECKDDHGAKLYQIYECLTLLQLDHRAYQVIKDATAKLNFTISPSWLVQPFSMVDEDNPWMKQYLKLFLGTTQ